MTDPGAANAFAGKLLNVYTGGMLTKMIDIGHQTGLFEASTAGPATSAELAERAGLQERYVREWLGAMTAGGIYRYEAGTGRYTLPEAHAVSLTGPSARNLGPVSRMIESLGRQLPKLVECFRHGGGIGYAAYRPEFTAVMDDVWRRIFDEQLIEGFIGAVDGLTHALHRGIRALDIGCGTGHVSNLLGRAFPRSTFVGYDIAEDAIAAARAEASSYGLPNVAFDVLDVSALRATPQFDLITAFDAIHDQHAPDVVLERAREALAPEGVFLMVEFKFASDVAANVGNPFAPLYYGFSCLHCMTVSLAAGGPGLGAVWGEQTARRMLAEAGFGRVQVIDSPRPQNVIYVCRR